MKRSNCLSLLATLSVQKLLGIFFFAVPKDVLLAAPLVGCTSGRPFVRPSGVGNVKGLAYRRFTSLGALRDSFASAEGA